MSTVMQPEVVNEVLEALKAGLGIETAASYVGCTGRTIKGWLAKGRAAIEAAEMNDAPIPLEDRHYADFAEAVDKARAQAIVRNVTAIQRAGTIGTPKVQNGRIVTDAQGNPIMEVDWRASAWWLERMHSDQFGQANRVELTGAGGGALEHVIVGAIDHQVSIDAAAHPDRTAHIAEALAEAGLLALHAPIDTTATEMPPDDPAAP